jgi:hypothetical protein
MRPQYLRRHDSPTASAVLGVVMAVVIGIAGALLLVHWASCPGMC